MRFSERSIAMSSSRIRRFTIACGIVAFLSNVTSVAPAQTPTPRDDTEKRLKAIEEKLDLLARSLEPRIQISVAPKAFERSIELLKDAKRMLAEDVEKAEQKHQDFRLRNPFFFYQSEGGPAIINVYVARLSKIESKRVEIRMKRIEMEAQASFIDDMIKAIKDADGREKAAKAILLTLQRRGVDVAAAQKIAGKNDSATDVVQLLVSSMQSEGKQLVQFEKELDDMHEQQQKLAREISNSELQDDQLRNAIVRYRGLFETLARRLSEIEIIREFSPQPKK
jgi:hypothetical protein